MMGAILILAVLVMGGVLLLGGAAVIRRLERLYTLGGEQHWDRLGARVQLLHGHSAQGGHVLDGLRDGVWLHVEPEGPWMVIRGRIEAQMPAGLSVINRGTARVRGLRVGSPVLDGLVCVQGGLEAAVLLRDPDLAGPLLAVVHAWPGSLVDTRQVTLRCPDAMGRALEARCAEVIALVVALRQAAARTVQSTSS
ncbi:MAG: hypothetical protein P8R54_26380 [Myxococcota bacterium]|nr:hypothetical protein [Myxococcota bacterium]